MIINEHSFGTDLRIRAYITPGSRIELHTFRKDALLTIKSFGIGDFAEYDAFNLRYSGRIKSITGKNVIIRPLSDSRSRRLNFDTFSWRNWDYDFEEVKKYNSEVSLNF